MSVNAGFSVRIVTADSYMIKPTAGLDPVCSDFGIPSARVPVVRIFGATPAGQTVCLHVHRVFPYFYVPYDGTSPAENYLRLFAVSLDRALNMYGGAQEDIEDQPDNTAKPDTPERQHVYKISIVKGIPFYGYYQDELMFLKIYFYSPQSIKRAVKVLLNGAILRKKFQPYESHIPYVLQFFMDYNLQGMNYINASAWELRAVNPADYCSKRAEYRDDNGSSTPVSQRLASSTTYHAPSVQFFSNANISTNGLKRTSVCELEVDVVSDHILNREEIEIKIGTNPGLAVIWRDENQRRAMRGLPGVINLPQSQDRDGAEPSKTDKFFGDKLRDKLSTLFAPTADLPVVTEEENRSQQAPFINESVLVGVSNISMHAHFASINNSFFLDRHADTDTRPSPTSDSVVDIEQIRLLQENEPDEDGLASILNDLAAMVDEERLDGSENGNPLNIFQADEEESGAMQETVLDFDTIDSPPPDPDPVEEINGDMDEPHTEPPLVEDQIPTDASDAHIQSSQENGIKETVLESAEEVVLSHGHLKPAPLASIRPPSSNGVDVRILTPALKFPSVGELDATVDQYNFHEKYKWSTYYSSLRDLGADLEPEKGEEIVEEPADFSQVLEPVEFEGWGMSFKSATLFQTGIQFIDELRLIKHREANPKADSKPAKPKHDNRWRVILTPAIGFPNLSHITRMSDYAGRKRLKDGNNKLAAQADPVSSECNGQKQGPVSVVSSGDSTRSAKKARNNNQFEELIGQNLATSLEHSKDARDRAGDNAAVFHESENLLLLSLELHADAAKDRCPDPFVDPVRFVTCVLMTDTAEGKPDDTVVCISTDAAVSTGMPVHTRERDTKRFIAWLSRRRCYKDIQLWFVHSEQELFQTLIDLVRSLDPDILIGYEVQLSSWGYLIERGNVLGLNMLRLLSRLSKPVGNKSVQQRRIPQAVADYEARKMSEHHLVGRIILNLWRLMKREVNLNIYSFENVVFNVLKIRMHLYTTSTITDWFGRPLGHFSRWRAMEYFITRSALNVALLQKLDLIRQTSEFSRLFGIQFYETLTRGSQWRVESMMLRLAKPFSFIPVSPSGDQLKAMAAQEFLPLILEPESRFYQDPVVVLDFQSLYPSMIIAYNYCYSTCLGKVENLGQNGYFKFGCTGMHVSPDLLKDRINELHFSPNGVAFVTRAVRCGILPQMLQDILNTRIMVKKSMANYKDNPVLKKVLHARQLALKLIANVTYGYTSASFSGRMPCIEIGDAIVSKARETLERAMKYIEEHPRWNARIVYGDTDSMFVLLPGRTKFEAFRIGREIESAITDMNPKPVKLKFEKVYLPCVLQTKKRYCGFMYENENQKEPIFDAKGIETVRRDTCPLVSKTLEDMIRMMFSRNCDILSVKHLVQNRFADVLRGNTKFEEFIFAKEYRGRENYKDGASVPALEIAKKLTTTDPRAEPRIGERVPYVITYGEPSRTLLSLVRQPSELFQDPSLRPHGYYYCSRQLVPVLNRVLLLLGLDSKKWLFQVQERLVKTLPRSSMLDSSTDLPYFRNFCAQVLLGSSDFDLLAENRKQSPSSAAEQFFTECRLWEKRIVKATADCQACMGTQSCAAECVSFDCPVLFQRLRSTDRLARLCVARDLAG